LERSNRKEREIRLFLVPSWLTMAFGHLPILYVSVCASSFEMCLLDFLSTQPSSSSSLPLQTTTNGHNTHNQTNQPKPTLSLLLLTYFLLILTLHFLQSHMERKQVPISSSQLSFLALPKSVAHHHLCCHHCLCWTS